MMTKLATMPCTGIVCTGTMGLNNACPTLLLEVEMPRSAKTWADKRRAKPPHTVTLDKDFAGVSAGSRPPPCQYDLRHLPLIIQ